MALNKQPVNINFAQGLDTKSDPYQVDIGKFLVLNNMVFDTAKRLTKRNGFFNLTTLPNTDQTTLTTLNDNLLATGSNLYAFSQETNEWLNQGIIQPIDLSVQSIVRVSTSQTAPDSAVSSNGLTCVTYSDNSLAYYHIIDSNTGQQVVPRTSLGTGSGQSRTYVLGPYFIITFTATVSAASHLRYVAIPISMPGSPLAADDISTTIPTLDIGYDAVVANDSLFIAWSDTGSTINFSSLTNTLILSSPTVINGYDASLMSVTADNSGSTPVIWITFWDSGSQNGYTTAYSYNQAEILSPTQVINNIEINALTSVAQNRELSLFYETVNDYASPYPGTVQSDYISELIVTQDSSVSSPSVLLRSVGLASKAFIADSGTTYMLVAYGESNQPTYFLIDDSGNIYMRLAYSNGGGYVTTQVLPNVSFSDDSYYVPYLIKDFLAPVNKNTNLPSGTPTNAFYTQTGINQAKFSINTSGQYSSEIASTLHLTGGQLWMYDGVKPVEHGFHVWPENIDGETNTGSGGLIAQDYYYSFTYEWTDNQGNLHRSAPSIPFLITTTTTSSTNTLYVPTLRLTYKISPNPVRIVGYRWSTAQQVYYQFTSLTSPTANDTSVDFVTITDTSSDGDILGNPILYTTGGVIENIAAPASTASCLFKNRLFLIDAEDPNLLWYSKQVIETTPVEMSDLLTLYIAPTTGAQGSTGPITALSAMDDKLIIFKKDAIYYIVGIGPDNTGANNDFTDPVFITASVGCDNPNSIVLMPNGIMFQSDKGIWLLGRDLSTVYIGAAVEAYNSQTVRSAKAIPGTNQVRFIISNSTTLVYDYYYNQWGTFSNLRAISDTLYQSKQTYLNEFGQIFQEASGTYTDGSKQVLMSFTTAWINIAGLQGFERLYFLYLLGTYFTPFKLNVGISYDYNSAVSQSIIVTPDNYSPPWGGEANWGSGEMWGGPGNVLEARIFPQIQKCQAFQITINEVYDSTYGSSSNKGLYLSGLNLVIGTKKGYRTQKAARSFG